MISGLFTVVRLAVILGVASAIGPFGAVAAEQGQTDGMHVAAPTPAPAGATATPKTAEPKTAEPETAKPKTVEPKAAEPKSDANPNMGSAEVINVQAQPVGMISGKAKWGDGLSAIMESQKKLKAALDKAGIKTTGHPQVLFTQTDDNGFTYEAMLPLAAKPEGRIELGDEMKIGSSPAGKAIKFQYHGPYDDIDSTYDLITAYLDEKDLEAQDYFTEEYMSALKGADDPDLAVDIYIFIK
jgi:effector-binding domain-containing protein